MALRYLILVAPDEPSAAKLEGLISHQIGLRSHAKSGRIRIMTSEPSQPHLFADDSGAIIGQLFHRHGAGPSISELTKDMKAAIAKNPCKELLERYWGSYVAVWSEGDRISVLRDPSGLLPCYYVANSEFTALASDAPLLAEAGLIQPSIDWSSFVRILYANELPLSQTALSGVSDLLAGTKLSITASGCSTVKCWSPWKFIEANPDMGFEEQAERLRRIVENSTRNWGATYGKGILAVSGGLDSSIVATCLIGAIPFDCLTISTSDPRGDESAYARTLCSCLSLELCCGHYALEEADILRSAVAHLPRPGGRAQLLAYDAAVLREMAARQADVFITGSGGDNIFLSTHSARPLVDRYLANGLGFELLDTLRDISRLTGASAWDVIRFALRVPRRPGSKYKWRPEERFLSPDAVREQTAIPLSHPWLEGPDDALPGKAAHISMIIRAQHYLHGYDRRLPFAPLHPLVSQPIVETALSIPSWFACWGGVDRATARRAFSEKLPETIVRRQLKGGPDGFAIRILEKNLPVARERLLDGKLSSMGILDRTLVDAALRAERLFHGTDYVRLLLLLDAEAWIDAWIDTASDYGAATPAERNFVGSGPAIRTEA